MQKWMRRLAVCALAAGLCSVARAQSKGELAAGEVVPGDGEQLMALANESRAEAGLGRLVWDQALTAAARAHCLRMATEGPIAHRYTGEEGLSDRAAKAGARFDLIEENVAVGPNPAAIHAEWMQSPGHRANLLNPEVNRVGIAVVAVRGVLYATADYAHSVQKLTQAQVEARVAELIRVSGVQVRSDPAQARAACPLDHGLPTAQGGPQATFVMRWQDSNLGRLPDALTEKLASGQYHMAAVGSCAAQGVEGSFTAYRVAVLLY